MSTESLPPDSHSDSDPERYQPRDAGDRYCGITTFVYDSRDNLMTVDLGDGRGPVPPAPFFHWERLADKRLFALTLTADQKTEYWRDNPPRYLVVEPHLESGEIRPVLKRGKPIYLWLCREEREPR